VNPDGFLDKFDCGINCSGDFAKMVDSLKSLLDNESYLRYGQNGRKYIEEYHDIIKVTSQYKDLFRQVLAR
jgi:glycosyltransferase involved in cell wall biosynthesis